MTNKPLNVQCDYCENKAVYKIPKPLGPPIYVCQEHKTFGDNKLVELEE